MVIPATCVGAVLGQKGRVIRGITRDSGAKLILEVGERWGPGGGPPVGGGVPERVMSIWGTAEQSEAAVRAVAAVVWEELGKGEEVELKLRARHELIGRLIGKGGENVKAMMTETGTSVSCAQELHPVYASGERYDAYGKEPEVLERTVSIRGSRQDVLRCLDAVTAALRDAWRHLQPRPHAQAPAPNLYPQPYPVYHPSYLTLPPLPLNANLVAPPAAALVQPQAAETVYLYVPANVVGALIGPKGAHIRNLIRVTGAEVRVETAGKGPMKEGPGGASGGGGGKEEGGESQQPRPRRRGSSEAVVRCVVIQGGPESQLRAQFWIFQRVCESRQIYFDDVKLTTDCPVPNSALGRLIGRQGQHLKDLQRSYSADLHILKPKDPEDPHNLPLLRIAANFNASQAIQARLRVLLHTNANYQQGPRSAHPSNPHPHPNPNSNTPNAAPHN